MLRFLWLFGLVFSAQVIFGQFSFAEGYFIDNNGNRTNCQIEHADWRVSPVWITYKTAGGKVEKLTIEDVQEFGLGDQIKYIRATVDVDLSSDHADLIKFSRNAVFEERTVWLKVVLEGEASLYLYKAIDIDRPRIFLQMGNGPIEQLVYKRYRVTNITMRKNEQYKQQLKNKFTCGDPDYSRLMYYEKGIRKVVEEYNKCIGSAYRVYEAKKKKLPVRFALRAGLQNSSFVFSTAPPSIINFPRKNTLRLGIGLEYFLPFKRPNLSITIQPAFKQYSATHLRPEFLINTIQIGYRAIELPFSFRYYPVRSDKLEIFGQVGFLMDFVMQSAYQYNNNPLVDMGYRSNNVQFAIGCNLLERFSLTFAYNEAVSFVDPFNYSATEFKEMSLMVGFLLFN